MRFGLDVAQQRLTWKELLDRVRLAESAGFDGIWGFDHFKPMYGDTPGPCFEGMTFLAAVAASTQRVRIGLLVTGVTYRHPSMLTLAAVTLDHVSSGRLELALGAAWFEEEHHELGIDFPPLGRRFDRLEDTLEVVHRLMSGETVSYEGKTMRLDGAQVLPLPVQRPHPPIWIGGSGERRTLPLAARYADMWHSYGSPEGLTAKSALIDRLAEAAGRDPASIGRASSLSLSGDLDNARRSIEHWQKAGFSYLVCGWPTEGQRRVEEFVEEVMPAHAG
jgi:F420-dependent oxidoreductase-like protein